MRGTLRTVRGAINLHRAFDADLYWVGFLARSPTGSAIGYRRPDTRRTLRGAAIQIASADTAQQPIASTKASR
jgi:hypothetical protein